MGIRSRLIASFVAALGLSACVATGSQNAGPAAAQALPDLKNGDTFVFERDDGRTKTMKVVNVQGERVFWRVGSNLRMETYRNFIIPPLSYETSTARAELRPFVGPGFLWPLRVGSSEWFMADNVYDKKDTTGSNTYRHRYKCYVKGQERTKVKAGVFDTVLITCDRYSPLGTRLYYTDSWWYAPAVNFYVKETREYPPQLQNRTNHTYELLSYSRGGQQAAQQAQQMQPSGNVGPSARPRMQQLASASSFEQNIPEPFKPVTKRFLNIVLETQLDNNMASQSLNNGTMELRIKPLSTAKRADGIYCRTFETVYLWAGQSQSSTGQACRIGGAWKLQ